MLPALANARALYNAETAGLSFRKLLCGLSAFGFRSFFGRQFRPVGDLDDRILCRGNSVFLAVILRAQAKDESGEDKSEGSLLFRRQDENLAAVLFRRSFHSQRRRTWSERYLWRMFWS